MKVKVKVKVKIAAEAPLNFRALIQIAKPPRTGAMQPTRLLTASLAPIPWATWNNVILPPISRTVTRMLKGRPFLAGCSLSP